MPYKRSNLTCIKYLFFAFNLFLLLMGGLLVSAGGRTENRFREYFRGHLGDQFTDVSLLMIVVGIVVMVTAIVGCGGACRDSECLVKTFCALLVVIIVLEMAGGIAGFALRGKVEGVVKDELQESLARYRYDNGTGTREMWDEVQARLRCCGVDGYRDWAGKLGHGQAYPASCCRDRETPGCGVLPALSFPHGCLRDLVNQFLQNLSWLGVTGLVVALVQVIGVLFACFLARAIGREYQGM